MLIFHQKSPLSWHSFAAVDCAKNNPKMFFFSPAESQQLYSDLLCGVWPEHVRFFTSSKQNLNFSGQG